MNNFFYKKVDAYHLAKEYVLFTYELIRKFPQYEQYALCDQMRRAAISIPSNIAEGLGRMSVKERIHFIENGRNSQGILLPRSSFLVPRKKTISYERN